MKSTRKQEKTIYWRASYSVLIICCVLGWLYVVERLPEASWVPVVFIPVVAAGSLVFAIIVAGVMQWMPDNAVSFRTLFMNTFIIGFLVVNLLLIFSILI